MSTTAATTEQMQLPSSSLRPTTLSSDEKLCLANAVEQYRLELLRQAVPNNENIHLSLCGGMGENAFGMRQVGAKFTKTILVGKDETKHTIYATISIHQSTCPMVAWTIQLYNIHAPRAHQHRLEELMHPPVSLLQTFLHCRLTLTRLACQCCSTPV